MMRIEARGLRCSRVFICMVVLFALLPAAHASAQAAPAPPMPVGALRVPILMYHYIRVNPVARDRIGADLSVTPAAFALQMQLLANQGFHAISLDDLTAALTKGQALPPRPVVLTFDDGYEDFYTAAYPVLQRYGFKATSFVITGKVGSPRYLTWDQMRTMEAGGLVQFESHTVDHAEMPGLSTARAQHELLDSKATLEKQLGVPVRYFCYPSGRYNARVESLVLQDGYLAAVSTRYGAAHSLGQLGALTRVRIHGGQPLGSFAAALGISGR